MQYAPAPFFFFFSCLEDIDSVLLASRPRGRRQNTFGQQVCHVGRDFL